MVKRSINIQEKYLLDERDDLWRSTVGLGDDESVAKSSRGRGRRWILLINHFGFQDYHRSLFILLPLFTPPNFHIYLIHLLWIPSSVLLRQLYYNSTPVSALETEDTPILSETDQAILQNLRIQLGTTDITKHSHCGTVSGKPPRSLIEPRHSPLSDSAASEAPADNLISS